MNEKEILLYNSLKGLHLLDKADTHTVVSDLIGLQAQFPSYTRASLMIRANDYNDEEYGKWLVRIWSHRGTMHIVPEDELGLHLAALDAFGSYNNFWGIRNGEEVDPWTDFILIETASGNNSREGLKEACRAAGMSEEILGQVFHAWGGLLRKMVMLGMLVCGTGTKKEYFIPKPFSVPSCAEARREMLLRYFKHYGPATLTDCRYFFGNWEKASMDALLEEALPHLYCIRIDGKKYYSCSEPVTEAEIPECLLIPGFDQLILGYKNRDRLFEKRFFREVTNQAGIVFPTILIRGALRARWKIEKDSITVEAFDRLLKKDEAAIKRRVRFAFGKRIKSVKFI